MLKYFPWGKDDASIEGEKNPDIKVSLPFPNNYWRKNFACNDFFLSPFFVVVDAAMN